MLGYYGTITAAILNPIQNIHTFINFPSNVSSIYIIECFYSINTGWKEHGLIVKIIKILNVKIVNYMTIWNFYSVQAYSRFERLYGYPSALKRLKSLDIMWGQSWTPRYGPQLGPIMLRGVDDSLPNNVGGYLLKAIKELKVM